MDWFAWLQWLEYWTGIHLISALDWLLRTIEFAGKWYRKAWMFFYVWWMLAHFLFTKFLSLSYRHIIDWPGKIIAIFSDWWARIYDFFVNLYERIEDVFIRYYRRLRDYLIFLYWKAQRILVLWYDRVHQVFYDWWTLVSKWFQDWCRFFVNLFEQHREKIIYCLTEGWPKAWWFIYTRFALIFQDFENHIEGWTMFISDPAQAIWDWFEPRAIELVASFLASIW